MKIRKILFVSALIVFSVSLLYGQKTPAAAGGLPLVTGKDIAVAQTTYGKVRGYIHNGIYTYKGIPYAKAERFMAPTKPDAWQDVRSSLTYGPVCPLIDPTTGVNDEVEFVFQQFYLHFVALHPYLKTVTTYKQK